MGESRGLERRCHRVRYLATFHGRVGNSLEPVVFKPVGASKQRKGGQVVEVWGKSLPILVSYGQNGDREKKRPKIRKRKEMRNARAGLGFPLDSQEGGPYGVRAQMARTLRRGDSSEGGRGDSACGEGGKYRRKLAEQGR